MDAWIPFAVRQHCHDAVQAWAELEGKSPQMSEDLARQFSPSPRRIELKLAIGLGVKVVAWAADAWLQITRR